MKVYLGADHRGFNLKEYLKDRLISSGYEVIDMGDTHLDPGDDYVDFAEEVAIKVAKNETDRGILVCGSGVGVDIVANKVPGIRSALVFDLARAKQSREHEDANVLSLPSDILNDTLALEMVKIFLETPPSNNERHVRRREKIHQIELKYAK